MCWLETHFSHNSCSYRQTLASMGLVAVWESNVSIQCQLRPPGRDCSHDLGMFWDYKISYQSYTQIGPSQEKHKQTDWLYSSGENGNFCEAGKDECLSGVCCQKRQELGKKTGMVPCQTYVQVTSLTNEKKSIQYRYFAPAYKLFNKTIHYKKT